jgi:hypothetical protein
MLTVCVLLYALQVKDMELLTYKQPAHATGRNMWGGNLISLGK